MSQLCTALMVVGLGVGACKAPDLSENVKWVNAPTYESHEPYFPINSGKHEGINCDKCHGDFDTFGQFTCISCHEHEETATSTIHTAVPEYEYSATSCFQCHPRGEAEGTGVNHEAYYPIGEDTSHNAQGCSDCHIVPGDRAQVSCIDCHDHDQAAMATEHGGTPGYEWKTPACLGCHRDGDALSRDVHDAIFPISVQTIHKETACSECHVDANDREAIRCVDCHAHESAPTQTEHVGVGGYGYITRDCMKCHFDASVPRLVDHVPFLIDAESEHKAENAPCLDCHTTELLEPFPRADFTKSDCVICHGGVEAESELADEHMTVDGYLFENQPCIGCHPGGQRGLPRADHDLRFFPISAGEKHEGTACADCHTGAAHTDNVTCIGCHDHAQSATETEHTEVGGYSYESGPCMKCHFDSSVPRLQDHGNFLITADSGHGPMNAECLSCHPAELPNRPFSSADFTESDCVTCHLQPATDTEHSTLPEYRYNNPSCINCHPDGQALSRADHEPIFSISMGTAHEGTACGGCHMDPLNNENITCIGCHHAPTMDERGDSRRAHAGVGGYEFNSVKCMECHDDARVDDPPSMRLVNHVPFRIDAEAKHKPEKAGCLECHDQPKSNRPFPATDFGGGFDCLGCHDDSNDLADEHRGESGYRYDSITCVMSGCHPNGEKEP